MLEVLCAEDSLLCFDGSSTFAWFIAMLDGDFVLSKAHAYKSNRKQQIRFPRLHRIWVPNTMEPRGKKYIGFDIIVFGHILPHKIGVSDLRSPNSPIQLRYTPNTMPIKDGLRPTLMRDRKRKIPDRKSAVSDLAKSFSFREQKLSYVRSKNRLGFTCGDSCIPLFASSNADR